MNQVDHMQMDSSSEQGSTISDYAQILLALRKMDKEIEVMVIRALDRVLKPIVETFMRKVVKEEILSALDKFVTGGNRNNNQGNETVVSRERNLELKFLDDEVSSPVLTGKEIKGKEGNPLTVALFDKITNEVVESGPGSSARVEILLLNGEHNSGLEDFNKLIIEQGDKTKPQFPKRNYVHLEKGRGVVENSKLGNDSSWMKKCKCRLGARLVGNIDGIKVQEAWTKSFVVYDSRNKLYEKSETPSLNDDIWRLKNIGKDGAPCKNLQKMNISKVKDFRFLHSVDPERLQKIAAGDNKNFALAKWKVTVDHAQTCIVDDSKIYLYPPPSSDSQTSVTFDVVGQLKGIIHNCQYIPITNLSDDEKACALELLRSAFEYLKSLSSFEDEASLLQKFPYKSSDMSGRELAISENTDGYDPMAPGPSCQIFTPTVGHFDSNVEPNHNQDPSCSVSNLEPGTSSQRINTNIRLNSPDRITAGLSYEPHLTSFQSSGFSDIDSFLGYFDDNPSFLARIFPEANNNIPQPVEAEPHIHQLVMAIIWKVRSVVRFMDESNIRGWKRRRMH